jgi:hypothetical protein
MTPKQIQDQIDAIRTVSATLIAEGPDACRKFLEDAGIISKPAAEPEMLPEILMPKAEAGDNQNPISDLEKWTIDQLQSLISAKDSEISRLKEELANKQVILESHGRVIRRVIQEADALKEKMVAQSDEIGRLMVELEGKQEARRLDREEYAKWIKGVFDDRTADWDIESLVHRLAFEFDAHVLAVYEGAEQWESDAKALRDQLLAGEHVVSLLREQIADKDSEIELLRQNGANLRDTDLAEIPRLLRESHARESVLELRLINALKAHSGTPEAKLDEEKMKARSVAFGQWFARSTENWISAHDAYDSWYSKEQQNLNNKI